MKSFQVYLEQIAASVSLNMDGFQQGVVDVVADLAWRHNEYQDSLKNFKLDRNKIREALQQIDGDAAKRMLQALEQDDKETISDTLSDLLQERKPEDFDRIRYVFTALRNYLSQVNPYYWTEEEEQKYAQQIVADATKNMAAVVNALKQAITRMPEWGNWQIVVTPSFDKDNVTAPVKSAYVEFQVPSKPGFSWLDGEIDDVLDGGDDEFFPNHHLEVDYFGLIAELRKPGSSSKGSVATVYTARPARDKHLYLNAKAVPANIYVTTSPNRAMSLSQDLAFGSETETRDVYKIRVDSRYLVLQYDAGSFKDYQLISRTGQVPVISVSQY